RPRPAPPPPRAPSAAAVMQATAPHVTPLPPAAVVGQAAGQGARNVGRTYHAAVHAGTRAAARTGSRVARGVPHSAYQQAVVDTFVHQPHQKQLAILAGLSRYPRAPESVAIRNYLRSQPQRGLTIAGRVPNPYAGTGPSQSYGPSWL